MALPIRPHVSVPDELDAARADCPIRVFHSPGPLDPLNDPLDPFRDPLDQVNANGDLGAVLTRVPAVVG